MSASPETYGSFKLRAVGAPQLSGAWIYRSGELSALTPEDALVLTKDLGIGTVIDIRNQSEIAAKPQIMLMGTKTVALEPSTEHRRKDANKRLVAGVIGEYGAPEERMIANYRRYAQDYPLLGTAMRTLANEAKPVLIHCENGKDRTGVICATLPRIAGRSEDEIMEDYLLYNELNRAQIDEEAASLDVGMTPDEKAILMSFLETRPAYLRAYFDEAEHAYGSFGAFLVDGLHLAPEHLIVLAAKVNRRI